MNVRTSSSPDCADGDRQPAGYSFPAAAANSPKVTQPNLQINVAFDLASFRDLAPKAIRVP
jgi:hypothetical protein